MKSSVVFLACLFCFAAAGDEPVTADSIMKRVAENQTRSVDARARWTYDQEVFVRLNRSNGKLAREERRGYTVMPTRDGLKRELVRFEGRYQDKGKTVEYDTPGFERKDMDIDADLIDDMPDGMIGGNDTRDGIDPDLFPLTPERQTRHRFQLHGEEEYKGRRIWRVTFEPLTAAEFGWAGEALIDTTEYQPVLITTHLSRKLPLAVRTILGTDLQHLGFKVEYARLAEGVWFPSRYSGEFNLKAVFFYRRKIALSMRNTEFQKTDVSSTIEYALSGEPSIPLPQ